MPGDDGSSSDIPQVQKTFDFGVIADSTFKPSAQIAIAVAEARSISNRKFARLTLEVSIPT